MPAAVGLTTSSTAHRLAAQVLELDGPRSRLGLRRLGELAGEQAASDRRDSRVSDTTRLAPAGRVASTSSSRRAQERAASPLQAARGSPYAAAVAASAAKDSRRASRRAQPDDAEHVPGRRVHHRVDRPLPS